MSREQTQGSGERLLSVLDLFTEARLSLTPQEMMDALGYTRPTLYRYLRLLRDAGFLTSDHDGRYALGPRFVELDFLVRQSDPLVDRGQVHIEALANRFPGTAFITRWYGDKLLCVASSTRDHAARSSYPRGRPMPLMAGAAAKVILAHLPRSRRQAYAEMGVGADQPERIKERLAELRRIRRDGFAIAHGEVTQGIVGIAAPILDDEKHPLGSLCVSMEDTDYTESDTDGLVRSARQAAEDISTGLDLPAEDETCPAPKRETAPS